MNNPQKITRADVIKVAAIVTAIPRWVSALIAAEGFIIPVEWRPAWLIFSVISAAGMAIVEGIAFAFVFNAWRTQKGSGWKLLSLALLSAILFVILLTPSIAASVRGQTLGAMLSNDYVLFGWSGVVAASTIAIVASVGYAERVRSQPEVRKTYEPPTPVADVATRVATEYKCVCGQTFGKATEKAIHSRYCEAAKLVRDKSNGHEVSL